MLEHEVVQTHPQQQKSSAEVGRVRDPTSLLVPCPCSAHALQMIRLIVRDKLFHKIMSVSICTRGISPSYCNRENALGSVIV